MTTKVRPLFDALRAEELVFLWLPVQPSLKISASPRPEESEEEAPPPKKAAKAAAKPAAKPAKKPAAKGKPAKEESDDEEDEDEDEDEEEDDGEANVLWVITTELVSGCCRKRPPTGGRARDDLSGT